MVDSLSNIHGLDAEGLQTTSDNTTRFLNPFAARLAQLSSTLSASAAAIEADVVSPALTIAARAGNLANTRRLLESGADPHLDLPAEHSPLFEAARHGHVKVTQLLLAERLRRGLWGPDRHLRDGRVLREAEERGDLEMIVLLTMEPADVLSAEDLDRVREGRGKRDSVISL